MLIKQVSSRVPINKWRNFFIFKIRLYLWLHVYHIRSLHYRVSLKYELKRTSSHFQVLQNNISLLQSCPMFIVVIVRPFTLRCMMIAHEYMLQCKKKKTNPEYKSFIHDGFTGYLQWRIGKLAFFKREKPKKPWFIAFANPYGINTPIMASFKLLMSCHWTHNWEVMLTTCSQ